MHVIEGRREREGKVGAHRHQLRVATVAIPAREARELTEVLAALEAHRAVAARPREPRHARSIAHRPPLDARADRLDAAHGLVPGHDRQAPRLEVALDKLEVRAADGARGDAEEQLSRPGSRIIKRADLEG